MKALSVFQQALLNVSFNHDSPNKICFSSYAKSATKMNQSYPLDRENRMI